ncbi:MAG: ABC transporter ATP-binding protein [Planctomycetia bacterium]|nr:ABC transporter ATP-binding protein [Planctomycetia bacterium]
MARDEMKPSDPAFTKAIGYLAYSSQARTIAYVSAAASAVVVIGLLGLLWLFVDYMVWRGHIPTFAELAYADKQKVLNRWNVASRETRSIWLTRGGFSLAEQQQIISLPGRQLKSHHKERLWEELVEDILVYRLGSDAFIQVFEPTPDVPSGYVMRRDDHGLISLVVRSDMRRLPTVVPWLASWNYWAWNQGVQDVTLFPRYLAGLALATVILGLAGLILVVVNREAAARAATEASSRLRRAVYHQTFRLGTLAVRALGPTEAVTLLTRHCESLHDALYTWLSSLTREAILIALLVLFAFWIDPLLSLAFVLVVVVVYAVAMQLLARFRRQTKVATNIAVERLTIIRESLMLMRLVKCYLMEPFNQSRIERQLARYAQAQRLRHRSEGVVMPMLVLVAGGCLLALFYVGALMVLYGGLPLAGAVTLATTCLCLYRPLDRYLEGWRLLKRGKESAQQIFAFLERKGDVGQVVGAEFLQPMTEQLEFDSVNLREPGSGRMLLDEVTFTISKGQRIGLIGSDELEKHALVYLIPRLLDPSGGEIRIDTHNVRWVTLDSLRAQIGFVMLHNLVFHDTVRNNIGCGDPSFALPQIIEAAKMARAHQFIQKLPQGYETPLGELGHTLSLSEQYRIALARAILRDPALLIIEEPEVELDEESKQLIDDSLSRLLPDRTTIFLPHRISTLKLCDKLYVLNKGRIVAAGTHKDLLSGNKLYRHLHYLEFNAMDER